jgi:SAM-dependent methyltransferase
MNEFDKKKIIERYNRRLRQFGVSIEALNSGTERHRQLRFDILRQIGIASGDSVLDLGCGFGDFFLYCRNKKLDVDYLGIDINPDLISAARKRFPGVKFDVKDIQKDPLPAVDWVVSTSSFNLRLAGEDNYKFITDVLCRSYALARKGVAIDFMTDYVDFRGNDKEVFYYSPEKVFSIAKSISKRACLRHDYPLFDFCVYLYPDFTGWRKKPSVALTVDIDMDYDVGYHFDEMEKTFEPIKKCLEEFPEIKTTWFIRIDSQIEALYGSATYVFDRHASKIAWLKRNGHEIGWHHHAYVYDRKRERWDEESDEKIICGNLRKYGRIALKNGIKIARMGWGFHTNKTIKVLDEMGFRIDSTAIPRPKYRWNDRACDWSVSPQHPYNPSVRDYRVPGDPHLAICEMPMTTTVIPMQTDTEKDVIRYVELAYDSKIFKKALDSISDIDQTVLIFHPHKILKKARGKGRARYNTDNIRRNLATLSRSGRRFTTIS